MPAYKVHDDAVRKCRSMIDANQYVLESSWTEVAPSADTANDKIERDGYEGYGEWFLGLDTEASDGTKDLYAFPFGDFQRVHRSALIAAKQRAAQRDHDAVERVADELLSHLDDVSGQG